MVSACVTEAQAADRCILRLQCLQLLLEALPMWQTKRGPLPPSGCMLQASGLSRPLIEGQEAALPAPWAVLAKHAARCTTAEWPAGQQKAACCQPRPRLHHTN